MSGLSVTAAMLWGTLAMGQEPTSAPPDAHTVTLTAFEVRDAHAGLLGVQQDRTVVVTLLASALRDRGFPIDTGGNEYALSGTLLDVRSVSAEGKHEHEAVVQWRLADVAADEVVYTAVTRGWTDTPTAVPIAAVRDVVLTDALDRLITREPFRDTIAKAPRGDGLPVHEWPAPLHVRTCVPKKLTLPGGLDDATSAVVVVRSAEGVGSGVVISPDGFVFTAAHVLPARGSPEVVTRSGVVQTATPIRVDPLQDVAVLKLAGSGYPCLGVLTTEPGLGADLYAVGSPAGTGLEFSVSRGIVSGVRAFSGWRYLQTDASINPGNSGGPLLEGQARVVAVVSFKIAGGGFEGLGFGVPSQAIVDRLGITFGASSSPDVAALSGTIPIPREGAFADAPDPPRLTVQAPTPAPLPVPKERRHAPLGRAGQWGIGLTVAGGAAMAGGAAIGTDNDGGAEVLLLGGLTAMVGVTLLAYDRIY